MNTDKCIGCPWKKDAGTKLVCMFSRCVKNKLNKGVGRNVKAKNPQIKN